ncbi:beta-propeller domain-containing protein [Brevundimonas sp.]|uniref:beta-propeller domain-containing protein n=1 Tax=Brevundimonas sp. TaxID=1871086 RepID=UPI002D2F1F02|nr:beta-propeller domain-containing protein [Brevundimonas sp.]HYC73793.1 beta-propeller domain-containing protein [Brevundimonas sp.]
MGYRVARLIRDGLVLLTLACPAGALAQEPATLQPVGSEQALQEIVAAAEGPDCDDDPALCPKVEPAAFDDQSEVQEIVVTGARAAAPSITNNQEVGVDEGDVVKARGDTLVILRRGRLFTVTTAGGRLRLVDTIEAYPTGVDARHDW